MHKLLGFSLLEKFHDGNNNTLYRAVRSADQLPVVIKLPRSEYPSHRELARLHNEYQLLDELAGAGVPKAYSLERFGRTVALVLEDMAGKPLNAVLGSRQLTISECLTITIDLTRILEQLHARQIIHRDIKPRYVRNDSAKVFIVPLRQKVPGHRGLTYGTMPRQQPRSHAASPYLPASAFA